MLQFVLFDIGESLPAGIDSLFQEFTQETIPFACYSETSASLFISDNRQTFMPVTALEKKMFFLDNIRQKYIVQQKDCLLITHSPEFAECARKQGYVCFGYTTAESSVRFPSLPLVLEGFEEVSLSFLQREFAHALREPAFICKTNRCNIQELSLTDVPFLYKMMQQESQVDTCTASDTTIGQPPVVFLPGAFPPVVAGRADLQAFTGRY